MELVEVECIECDIQTKELAIKWTAFRRVYVLMHVWACAMHIEIIKIVIWTLYASTLTFCLDDHHHTTIIITIDFCLMVIVCDYAIDIVNKPHLLINY